MSVTMLPKIIDINEEKPTENNDDHPMRKLTYELAFNEEKWNTVTRNYVREFFDNLAPVWSQRAHAYRMEPLKDALSRGGPYMQGWALEVGSGTGILTPIIKTVFKKLVSLEVSWEMSSRAPDESYKVLADAKFSPFEDNRFSAIILVNAFLFPREYDRILSPNGHIIWVSTWGKDTPIYLKETDVNRALGNHYKGVASEAGWGSWAVFEKPAEIS
jgi:ubiquinone/menaquinone biosynthesis C-methylase UbiE